MPRRYGQHFLARESVLLRIAEAVCPEHANLVIEIGPGRGALTAHLLERADRVVAIEIDPILVQYLRAKFRDEPRLEVVEDDILKTDLAQWGHASLAGNLPYYITSPIVSRFLAARASIDRAVFLVQKEVAERLRASPGSRNYGYLSVSAQLSAKVELLFDVPPSAFRPPPKVDSAVVRFTPMPSPGIADAERFLEFAAQAFQHKRKTLRNNLSSMFPTALLDRIPESRKRAEQLSIEELSALHRRLSAEDAS